MPEQKTTPWRCVGLIAKAWDGRAVNFDREPNWSQQNIQADAWSLEPIISIHPIVIR